jgi:hypothetical protein
MMPLMTRPNSFDGIDGSEVERDAQQRGNG